MPIEVFWLGGPLSAAILGTRLYHLHGWPAWQCILLGIGIVAIALLLARRYGWNTPTV